MASATMRADFDQLENPLMSDCQTPIIVALDFPTRDAALKLADQLDPKLCRVKVGKELFTSCAAEIVGTLRDKGFEVFLDLKFHDIPNTTAMAVKAAAEMGVWMVNVHCSGGLRMMAACREELDKRTGPQPLLIGVTVLTSMERDQRRILTPRQALDAGSDYLVIGRPISQAADPAKALAAVVAEIA